MNLRSRNARLAWRGGRAVDRAGLENRKAERSREFESHPLRFPGRTSTAFRCCTPRVSGISFPDRGGGGDRDSNNHYPKREMR